MNVSDEDTGRKTLIERKYGEDDNICLTKDHCGNECIGSTAWPRVDISVKNLLSICAFLEGICMFYICFVLLFPLTSFI